MSTFPECDKLNSIKPKSQIIGEFLEWLSKQNYEIRDWNNQVYSHGDSPGPINLSIEQLLAKYFEIDLNKVEEEFQQLLKEIRNHERGE